MSEASLPFPGGSWKETFPRHLLAIESCFLERNFNIQPLYSVYLAGIVSRRLDEAYWKQVETQFLVEYPEEIDDLIRKHYLYIGQNAPIVTVSRYNAEHHFMSNAFGSSETLAFLSLRLPIRYFGIASTFSYQSGKKVLGDIFRFFSRNIENLLKPLKIYLDSIYGRIEIPEPHPLIREVWEKFANSYDRTSGNQGRMEYDATVDLGSIIQGFRSLN